VGDRHLKIYESRDNLRWALSRGAAGEDGGSRCRLASPDLVAWREASWSASPVTGSMGRPLARLAWSVLSR